MSARHITRRDQLIDSGFSIFESGHLEGVAYSADANGIVAHLLQSTQSGRRFALRHDPAFEFIMPQGERPLDGAKSFAKAFVSHHLPLGAAIVDLEKSSDSNRATDLAIKLARKKYAGREFGIALLGLTNELSPRQLERASRVATSVAELTVPTMVISSPEMAGRIAVQNLLNDNPEDRAPSSIPPGSEKRGFSHLGLTQLP
jgi:hypothetical protein